MKPTSTTQDEDDMPAEVNFTGATRGKFYRASIGGSMQRARMTTVQFPPY